MGNWKCYNNKFDCQHKKPDGECRYTDTRCFWTDKPVGYKAIPTEKWGGKLPLSKKGEYKLYIHDNVALHYDTDKPMVQHIPGDVMLEVGKVITYGSKKYKVDNWKCGSQFTMYTGSALRHIYKWLSGEENDSDSKLNHLSHAICDLIFVLYYCLHYYKYGQQYDDRTSSEENRHE